MTQRTSCLLMDYTVHTGLQLMLKFFSHSCGTFICHYHVRSSMSSILISIFTFQMVPNLNCEYFICRLCVMRVRCTHMPIHFDCNWNNDQHKYSNEIYSPQSLLLLFHFTVLPPPPISSLFLSAALLRFNSLPHNSFNCLSMYTDYTIASWPLANLVNDVQRHCHCSKAQPSKTKW